jgi:uncharacterized protein
MLLHMKKKKIIYSGHGVCGLSRKSPKSLVLVSTFMASGVLTQTILKPALFNAQADILLPAAWQQAMSNVGNLLFPLASIAALLSTCVYDERSPVAPLIGVFTGGMFGLGLIISGMAEASKVVGFLDVTGNWDPSLMFVMGGAIAAGIAPFTWIQNKGKTLKKHSKGNAPYLFPNESFSAMSYIQPSSWSEHPAKARSLIGAIFFGAGWAISGMCPGPGLVLGGTGSSDAVMYIPAVLLGQWLSDQF